MFSFIIIIVVVAGDVMVDDVIFNYFSSSSFFLFIVASFRMVLLNVNKRVAQPLTIAICWKRKMVVVKNAKVNKYTNTHTEMCVHGMSITKR